MFSSATNGLAGVETQLGFLLERAMTGVAADFEQRFDFPQVIQRLHGRGAQASAKNDDGDADQCFHVSRSLAPAIEPETHADCNACLCRLNGTKLNDHTSP